MLNSPGLEVSLSYIFDTAFYLSTSTKLSSKFIFISPGGIRGFCISTTLFGMSMQHYCPTSTGHLQYYTLVCQGRFTLNLMLVVANFANTKLCKNLGK